MLKAFPRSQTHRSIDQGHEETQDSHLTAPNYLPIAIIQPDHPPMADIQPDHLPTAELQHSGRPKRKAASTTQRVALQSEVICADPDCEMVITLTQKPVSCCPGCDQTVSAAVHNRRGSLLIPVPSGMLWAHRNT